MPSRSHMHRSGCDRAKAAGGLAAIAALFLLGGAASGLAQQSGGAEMSPQGAPMQPNAATQATQQAQPSAGSQQGGSAQDAVDLYDMGTAGAKLLQVPVSSLAPGGATMEPDIKNPVADDPQAAQRGMQYFNGFNCVGCHAANGGGGMGPALSNSKFIYGSSPANIFLTIYQGRPNGMPAWGGTLPPEVIWDLVAYVLSISKEPSSGWGQTTSLQAFKTEQVPAEHVQSAEPWSQTEAFSFGKKPNTAK